ncbi:MAG TPA: RDD family protein [Planctomycetaceae bacterium]|nr:RDD family protein [Planctomycetaceae bacterium]
MVSPASDEGVYFARSDCAGLGRRLLIVAIDLSVVCGGVGFAVALSETRPGASPAAIREFAWCSLLSASLIYLAVLKRTSLSTLGYRLCDVRIVTLRGERPSVLRMTCRLLLWAFGPFNPVLDWLWLGGDPSRQTLRDKVAGTLVVRRNAVPAGRGRIAVAFYDLFTLSIPFLEVRRPDLRGGPVHAGPSEPSSDLVAGSVTRQPATRTRNLDPVGIVYALLAAGGAAWVASGSWTVAFDESPRWLVVDSGDQVLYAGRATPAKALELAEILTDLGHFGDSGGGFVYLDASRTTTTVSFFAEQEAWYDPHVLNYYKTLAAGIAEREFASPLHVTLRTPDWQQERPLEFE